MGVVTATELRTLAGRAPASSDQEDASPAVPDEEALSAQYIPADGLSACLITPHRILVTAGAAENDRVLPFSVIRYLDLSQTNHTWTKPQHLRRKRGSTDIPVPRVEHSLTHVPHDGRLYLFGGMKIDPDMGDICKTLFAFDPRNRNWQRVETEKKVKTEQGATPGPRYAHSAVFVQLRERGSRPNSRVKPVPSLVVYGGYSSHDDHAPRSDVHVLNVRTCQWALHPTKGSLMPGRANHAAVVTKNHRYMVIHGGNHSDDDDASIISDMLFVYDFQEALWLIPERRPSSAAPPTARRRHSFVNGVGRHDGWLIMYGGHLRDGNFSNDMFMCRLVESSRTDKICVVWEKVDVRGSVQRPLEGGNALKRRTVAGGCLVPIPTLRKYILLGGKGELGLRDVPLLLDPYESDEIAILQSVPVEEEEEEEDSPSLPERIPAMNGGDKKNACSTSHEADENDREEDFVFDMEKNTLQAVAASKTRRARSAVSTPPGDNVSSARREPSVSVTPSEKSPNPSSTMNKASDKASGGHPTANVTRPVTVRLRVRSADKKEKKKVESRRHGADFMSVIKKRPRSGQNGDLVTPPTKRGRFLAPEESDDVPPLEFGDDDSDAALNTGSADRSPSYRSKFLSASELARKGKKAGRGRGKGRGRDGRSARTRSADDRAEEKRYQALEKLNQKNEENIAYLEAEKVDLVKEITILKKDNHDLNEQYKSLLEDFRASRLKENVRKKDAIIAVTAQAKKPNGSTPGSQVENNGRPSTVTEADSLRAKIAELQVESAKASSEKEELVSTMQELEEEKRDIQKELFITRNKIERTIVDRDSYHQEMKQLRKDLVVMTKDKEAAEKRTQKAEENLMLKKREVELLKADIMVEQQHRKDGKLDLSTADRKVKIVQGQLAEATKRSDDFEAREKQLRMDLEKAEERNTFLQRQLEDAHAGSRKLEDEKIEISSHRESLRIELNERIKECSSALKDVEKYREALEKERLRRTNEDAGGEYVRLKAEMERSKKECLALRKRCERFGSLECILPRLQAIGEEVSSVFADDKERQNVVVALSQARGGDRDNEARQRKAGTGSGTEKENEKKRVHAIGEPAQDVESRNEQSSRNLLKRDEGPEDPVTIPDSDDADEP